MTRALTFHSEGAVAPRYLLTACPAPSLRARIPGICPHARVQGKRSRLYLGWGPRIRLVVSRRDRRRRRRRNWLGVHLYPSRNSGFFNSCHKSPKRSRRKAAPTADHFGPEKGTTGAEGVGSSGPWLAELPVPHPFRPKCILKNPPKANHLKRRGCTIAKPLPSAAPARTSRATCWRTARVE